MTIEDAIKHCRDTALSNAGNAIAYLKGGQKMLAESCEKCAAEHEQLAKWLEELKQRRDAEQWIPCSERFAHNLNRLEAALYNIDGRIERTQDNLAKLRLDHAEAQKIVAEPFPQQEELDTKEQRLKVVTDELNQAAIEAKKNAPKREKTCYFERAKMKRDAARLAKKPRAPKDQTKGRSKKQGIE